MAGESEFSHGDSVLQADYTPGAAVAAGEVVVVGANPYVAHRAIASGVLGSLAIRGGVYKLVSDGTVDTPGVLAYWDDTAKKITATSATNQLFGVTVPSQGATADDDPIYVEHSPTGVIGV